jgi:hypothetical protein
LRYCLEVCLEELWKITEDISRSAIHSSETICSVDIHEDRFHSCNKLHCVTLFCGSPEAQSVTHASVGNRARTLNVGHTALSDTIR